MAEIFGPLETAGVELASSDPVTFLFIGRVYYNTSSNVLKIYNGSAWKDFVVADLAQTLDGKTLVSPVINTGVSGTAIKDEDDMASNSDTHLSTQQAIKAYIDSGQAVTKLPAALSFDHISTPSSPSSGENKLYFKNDDKLYKLNSGGTEQEVGSGGGAGGINQITNPSPDTNTDDWASYADAAAVIPDDADGGSPNITFTRSTSSPLRNPAHFLITKDASNRQGEGVSTTLDFDNADKNKVLGLSFDYDGSLDTDYASDDIVIFIYDVTNDKLITPSGDNGLKASRGRYSGTWVSTDSSTYKLVYHIAGTTSAAWTFAFTNVKSSPELSAQGVPQSDWTSYTPATAQNGFGNTANHALQYKRISDSLLIRGFFQAGTVAASEARLDLPTGLTIGGDSGGTVSCGTHYEGRATSANKRTLLGTQGDSYLNFGIWDGSTAPQTPQNGSTITQSSQYQHIETGLIPIAEWAGSSVNLSVAVAEYAYTDSTWDDDSATDGSDTVYSTSGQVMAGTLASQRNKYVKFRTAIQPTDVLKVELSTDGVTWSGEASVNWQTLATFNSTAYGVGIKGQDAADGIARITFGRYRLSTGATYGSAGADWSSSFYWRVVKYPGVIQTATPNAVKWQKKALTSDENTDQTLSDMTFSNLTVGKTYRLSVQAQFSLTGNSSTSLALIDITHNSAVIGRIQARTDSYSGNDDRRFTIGWSFPFVAAASTLTFEYNQGTTNDTVEGSGGATFAILEELPTHVETSEW